MRRCFDADYVNRLVNHPSVRPWAGGDGVSTIDLSDAVSDKQNHFMMGEYGGFAACWSAPHSYEFHVFFLPKGRGRIARRLAPEMMDYMKAQGAKHLWGRIRPGGRYVALFARANGLRPDGQHTAFGIAYDLYSWRSPCLPQ